MRKNNSRLIILEGIDGSGKSTQQQTLIDALTDRDIPCIGTSEPYDGCETGRLIRRILKHEVVFPGREVMIHLFTAAAYYQNEKVIQPYLKEGVTVICDRYMYSTYAYNISTVEESKQVMQMHKDTVILPDMVIWLNLPVREAMQRATMRGRASEYYEKESTLLQVAWMYKKMFTLENSDLFEPILHDVNIIEIDAMCEPEAITQDITQTVLTTYFPEKL